MRPLTQVDPGGEVYLQFARRKLVLHHTQMLRSGQARLSRTYFVSDGTTIYIQSVYLGQGQFRDSIRIKAAGISFDFLVMRHIVGGAELWALKRDSDTGLYVPFLTDTLTATHNPWNSTDSEAAQPETVTRDIEHGASMWGDTPLTLRRGVGSSPADTRTIPVQFVFANTSTPASGMLTFLRNNITGPATLRRLGDHADTDFPLADFITRAKVVFPTGSSWSYSITTLYPVAPNKVLAITRPTKLSTRARTIYAERFRVDVDVNDNVTLAVEEVLKADDVFSFGSGTEQGERYFFNPFDNRDYSFRAGVGEREWSKYTFTDVTPAGHIRGPNINNPSEPTIPRPFNAVFIGASLLVTGPAPVPKAVVFNGATVHDELSPNGFPFLCNVWPVAVRIEDDQYWWINAELVKSSEIEDPLGSPGDYVYTSPHEYRYHRVAMKNGAAYLDQTDSRNFTSTSDGAPTDSWDSTTPVYIYIPTDGARIGAVDWFCGVRVEEVFASGGTGGVGALTHKLRPAVWNSSLSVIHTYADFEQSPAAYTMQSGTDAQRHFFARYNGAQFFVFMDPINSHPWGVGMDAPAEAPVRLFADDPVARQDPAVRSL